MLGLVITLLKLLCIISHFCIDFLTFVCVTGENGCTTRVMLCGRFTVTIMFHHSSARKGGMRLIQLSWNSYIVFLYKESWSALLTQLETVLAVEWTLFHLLMSSNLKIFWKSYSFMTTNRRRLWYQRQTKIDCLSNLEKNLNWTKKESVVYIFFYLVLLV